MSNLLLIILPLAIAYAVLRAVMHYRAGRKMWMAQFIILGCFMLAVLLYEIYIQFLKGA